MRNFDNYEQIHDNEGNLLIGKLVFCRKGTTTQEPVYAWDSEHNDYVAINPEVLININGRPDQQIFLSDTDYTIYVFKYIGNGEMDQDSDENNWLAQYSFNNLYLTFGVDIKTDSPYLVSNMAELQETDPANVGVTAGKTLVCLGGYNALGDCPPVFYYWDNLSTKTANGVDIVAVTGISVGRWFLVNTFTEIGFDVRHAGCFAEKTAAETSINQSYAIQRADTYALKYGLKIVFPDLYSDTYSYYLLTNLIVNSEVIAADGVKLITSTSATLNFVSEENLKKKVPFVLHDATYNGTWTLKGETIRTGYFENQESLSNTNWPPTITANKKYIYDNSFDCYATTPHIQLNGIKVEFLNLLEKEIYEFTNCEIESLRNIKNTCYFTNCEVLGTFFDSTANIRIMRFTGCVSDIDTWENVDNFVWFAYNNGEYLLDLKNRTCTIDFYNDGEYFEFPFTYISNAIFSSNVVLPERNGVKQIALRMNNCRINHLKIFDGDSLLYMYCYDSNVTCERVNYGNINNCNVIAEGSTFTGDEFICKTFDLRNCVIRASFYNYYDSTDAIAIVCGSQILANITLSTKTTFQLEFCNNEIYENARLFFQGNTANISFVNTNISNNHVADGPREFIVNNVGNYFNLSNIGNYEYKNNTGTLKAEDSIKLALRIPWYSYGATIPSGVKRYLLQKSPNDNLSKLIGVSIKDLFFSFGENTTRDILATTDPHKTLSSYSMIKDYDNNGTDLNPNTYDNVAGCAYSVLYRKGLSASKGIFNGSFQDDLISVAHSGMSNGDLCSIVLIAEKVYRADSTREILK